MHQRQRRQAHRGGDGEVVTILAPGDDAECDDGHDEAQAAEPDRERAVHDRGAGVPGPPLHEAGDGRVEAQADRQHHVDREVDPEDLQRRQRGAVGHVERPGEDEQQDECAQLDQLDPHVLHQVVVDPAAALDRRHDRGEVVVREDHVRGFLRHLGARDPHRDTDVRTLERGGVVDPVTGHRDDVAVPLQHVDEPHLVLRSDPGHHSDLAHLCARAPRR